MQRSEKEEKEEKHRPLHGAPSFACAQKYTFLDRTFECINGDHLSFISTAAKNRYLEQGSFQCRVIKTLLHGTIELGPYEL